VSGQGVDDGDSTCRDGGAVRSNTTLWTVGVGTSEGRAGSTGVDAVSGMLRGALKVPAQAGRRIAKHLICGGHTGGQIRSLKE
jgi:hypothetical protein